MYTTKVCIFNRDGYRIVSYGNGAAYTFQRAAYVGGPFHEDHGRSVSLQGDDATAFRDTWEAMENAAPDRDTWAMVDALWKQYGDGSRFGD